eukprot:TRINITY_DN1810_c0_g1_i1.p1 TRINITY_DN1810_c0_g1~~TRINITY_DN1810_c0_g1_i1.p1  ORF type:complete len:556 (-),score=43.69 TRINITY_DN1810_c0_g1_i1:117-1784(-)
MEINIQIMTEIFASVLNSGLSFQKKVNEINDNAELMIEMKKHANQCITDLKRCLDAKDYLQDQKDLVESLTDLKEAIEEAQDQVQDYKNTWCLAKVLFSSCIMRKLTKADNKLLERYKLLHEKLSMASHIRDAAVTKCLHEHDLFPVNTESSHQRMIWCAFEEAKVLCEMSSLYWHCAKCERNFCDKCRRYYLCRYDHDLEHKSAINKTRCMFLCRKEFEAGTPGWVCSSNDPRCKDFFICDECLPKDVITTRCWEKHELKLTDTPVNIITNNLADAKLFICKCCNQHRHRERGRWACTVCMNARISYEICCICRPEVEKEAESPIPLKPSEDMLHVVDYNKADLAITSSEAVCNDKESPIPLPYKIPLATYTTHELPPDPSTQVATLPPTYAELPSVSSIQASHPGSGPPPTSSAQPVEESCKSNEHMQPIPLPYPGANLAPIQPIALPYPKSELTPDSSFQSIEAIHTLPPISSYQPIPLPYLLHELPSSVSLRPADTPIQVSYELAKGLASAVLGVYQSTIAGNPALSKKSDQGLVMPQQVLIESQSEKAQI